MMRRLALIGSLAVLAVACGGEAAPEADEAETAVAAETSPLDETDASTDATPTTGASETAEPTPSPAPADAIAENMIPAQYHGVWDYEEGTCAMGSDARTEISAREIMFYESIGAVTSVKAEADDVLVELDMEGEGETWSQITRLSLSGSGADERLNSTDGERPKPDEEFPKKRCPR